MIPVLQESQNFPSPNISVIKLFSIYNSQKKSKSHLLLSKTTLNVDKMTYN